MGFEGEHWGLLNPHSLTNSLQKGFAQTAYVCFGASMTASASPLLTVGLVYTHGRFGER